MQVCAIQRKYGEWTVGHDLNPDIPRAVFSEEQAKRVAEAMNWARESGERSKADEIRAALGLPVSDTWP